MAPLAADRFVDRASDNPSAASAISAMTRVIGAASAHAAWGRASHNPPVVGLSETAADTARTAAHPVH